MADNKALEIWKFINDRGDFELEDPQMTSGLYFPLANEKGLMSSITPMLGGDIKTGQNTYLMEPVSIEDLHNRLTSRNFWIRTTTGIPWSAAGCSLSQRLEDNETVKLTAGFLWHKVERENRALGIKSEIMNFVPVGQNTVELMKVTLTNTAEKPVGFTPTVAVPMYGRSADDIRDHRHVTSLLNRIHIKEHGILLDPTLTFDERGHGINSVSYSVYAAEDNGSAPIGFFPILEDFIGEGGNLQWPEAVVRNKTAAVKAGSEIDGYEAIGAMRFADVELAPKESKSFVIIMGISDSKHETDGYIERYGGIEKFDRELESCCSFWEEKLSGLDFRSSDRDFDRWMKWVGLQPVLRRIYGCSFLPHHDYGKGGRGWRDLWQDCLALLLIEAGHVRDMLVNNYAGVRLDGSNATIIGRAPGEFIADRNNIPRTWMDHGAWPYFATRLYLDLSGDLEFLLEQQVYFKDGQTKRSTIPDELWSDAYGSRQKDEEGSVYTGTILEHILLEQVTAFFNVGEHNNMRLEGGDWNDGFDMAGEKGESVAFTALFGSNLMDLGKLLLELKKRLEIDEVELAKEILVLFDTITGRIDYDSAADKNRLLDRYMETCVHNISGSKEKIRITELAEDLKRKADWIFEHVKEQEWIRNSEGFEWFNGYYDNNGNALEGGAGSSVRMTLTGQVFPIMGGIADDGQVHNVVKAVNNYLKDPAVGGIRLNTNFNEVKLDMGRCFGFAFGHKENGAMFSHMTMMYINALYKRGFVKEGYEILSMVHGHCSDFGKSRIYPGIPEYINARGRGMYHYLTGAASWLLLTMRSEVYGIKGFLGDMVLEPRLMEEQFDAEGKAAIHTVFRDRHFLIEYLNKDRLSYGDYGIGRVLLDGVEIASGNGAMKMTATAHQIDGLDSKGEHRLVVELIRKGEWTK